MIPTQTSFLLVSCFYYFEVLGKQTQGLHTKPSITELHTLQQQQKQELNSKHHSDPPKFYPAFSLITKSPSLLMIPSYINPLKTTEVKDTK